MPMKVFKIIHIRGQRPLLRILLMISLLINSAGQGFALRPKASVNSSSTCADSVLSDLEMGYEILDPNMYGVELYDVSADGNVSGKIPVQGDDWLRRIKQGRSFARITHEAAGKTLYLADNHGLLPIALRHYEKVEGIDGRQIYTAIDTDYHKDRKGIWKYRFPADSDEWYRYERGIRMHPEVFTFEIGDRTWVSEGNFWTYLLAQEKLSKLIHASSNEPEDLVHEETELQVVQVTSEIFRDAENITSLLEKGAAPIQGTKIMGRNSNTAMTFVRCHADYLEPNISNLTQPAIVSLCFDELAMGGGGMRLLLTNLQKLSRSIIRQALFSAPYLLVNSRDCLV